MPKKPKMSEILAKHGIGSQPAANWDNTALQAVRLVGELCGTEGLNPRVMQELQVLMDLKKVELDELVDRCQAAWDEIKLALK